MLQTRNGRQAILIEIEKAHSREFLHVQNVQSISGQSQGTKADKRSRGFESSELVGAEIKSRKRREPFNIADRCQAIVTQVKIPKSCPMFDSY